ncbi:MAG: GNAT family N-acetyltransferase [Methanobacteriaceae archaeon]|nr:GNAT family N-acetyltransferase [Methanobacteriaceae archaeon]
MSFKIRQVKEEEFIELASLSLKCPPMVTERNSIYHIFTKFFNNTSLVAEEESGNIIAFLLGFISQVNPGEAYIHLLCVDPRFRRNKIASMLIEKFTDLVSIRGCRKMFLITGPENRTAQKLYKKMGFEAVKNDKTMEIKGISVVKDYNGPGDHKVLFYRDI